MTKAIVITTDLQLNELNREDAESFAEACDRAKRASRENPSHRYIAKKTIQAGTWEHVYDTGVLVGQSYAKG